MSDLFTWIITILVFQGVAALVNRSNKAKKKADAQRRQGHESEDSPNQGSGQNSPENANPLADFFENLEKSATNSQPNQGDSIQNAGVIAPQTTSSYELHEESQLEAYSHSESEDSEEEERREDEEYALQKKVRRNQERMEEVEKERIRFIGRPRPLDRIPQMSLLEQGMLWKEILGKPKGLQ
jgi:hypothetical protein